MKRREFVTEMLGVAAASAGLPATARVLGANDRVNIGWVGCGGRGRYDAGILQRIPGVEIIAVCDVYEAHARAAQAKVGARCECYHDFRKVLERKDVDAVLIATPDHWHATTEVLACQAGKDVYVEKPLSHTIEEGRKMVAAARRHNRIVQLGTQQRSAPHLREAAHVVQSGAIGPVHFVRVWNYLNMSPDGVGYAADSAAPPGLDWDFYLGPAPYVPFNKNRFLVSYRWFWDYAGGMATDYGTHRFDTVHEIMNEDKPLTANAAGGRYVLKDGGDTPDTLQITYEYPGFVLSYEASMVNGHGCGGRTTGMHYYLTRCNDDRPHGMAFYGTRGSLYADRVGFQVYPEPKGEFGPGAVHPVEGDKEGFRMPAEEVQGRDTTDLHIRNFIDCVRSRRHPVADVEIGHRSTNVPLLGNIALRTGHKIHWNAETEQITGDPEASALLARPARKPWDLI
jgi:predicted dehydrogenase